MSENIQIVVADDHAVLRESLAALPATQPGFEVSGKAGKRHRSPQTRAGEASSRSAARSVHAGRKRVRCLRRTLDREGSRVAAVVLTGSDSHSDYLQVVRLGARGSVLKGDDLEHLSSAIRAVASGELWFPPEIAQQVLTAMAGETAQQPASIQRLSERERQIATLVASGLRNRDIAEQLKISENTVKRHLQSIFDKTGARDRLQLAVMALGEMDRRRSERGALVVCS